MSNKEYRLERLREGSRYKESEAQVQTANAKIATAKENLAKYKSQAQTNKSTKALARQIRQQERRKSKQGSTFKKISKAVGYKAKLSNTLLSYANADGNSQGQRQNQGSSNRPVGRPQGSLKHRSPFNGQPLPAQEFYRQMRQFRRQQSQQADVVQEARQRQFAQQGVPPNQIQRAVQERMRQQFVQAQIQGQRPQPQMQQVNPNPPMQQQVVPQGNPMPQKRSLWSPSPMFRQNVPPSKLAFINQIEQGQQLNQPFQQKWL